MTLLLSTSLTSTAIAGSSAKFVQGNNGKGDGVGTVVPTARKTPTAEGGAHGQIRLHVMSQREPAQWLPCSAGLAALLPG